MANSDQHKVRIRLRDSWAKLLDQELPDAISEAQSLESASVIARELWPACPPDQLVRLDRCDHDFAHRVGGLPSRIRELLSSRIASAAANELSDLSDVTPWARGSRLKKLVIDEVNSRWDEVLRAADRYFENWESDRWSSPALVRERVIQFINDRTMEELQNLQPGAEDEARRRLKLLAALGTTAFSLNRRKEVLQGIKDGSTASFPYVPKYLSSGEEPVVRSFDCDRTEIQLAGFEHALVSLFPEALHLRECLERFVARQGIFSEFRGSDAALSKSLQSQFDKLPDVIRYESGGLWMPKQAALEINRDGRFRMVDGVVCAVGLGILIESVLQQCRHALGLQVSEKSRPDVILKHVADAVVLRPETRRQLTSLFDSSTLSPRDAMAHGVFFADDESLVEQSLVALTWTLRLLMEDLKAAALDLKVLGASRWDAGHALSEATRALIDEQGKPGLHLVDQLGSDEPRAHLFKMIARLTPDKRLMGWSAVLFWVHGDQLTTSGNRNDFLDFAAMLGAFIVLEEVWRAVYEAVGESTLVVSDAGKGSLKCELAFLDNREKHLLHEPTLRRVLGDTCDDGQFFPSMAALRTVRDLLFHGRWKAIPAPYGRYTHLAMKILFTLCGSVDIAHAIGPEREP